MRLGGCRPLTQGGSFHLLIAKRKTPEATMRNTNRNNEGMPYPSRRRRGAAKRRKRGAKRRERACKRAAGASGPICGKGGAAECARSGFLKKTGASNMQLAPTCELRLK